MNIARGCKKLNENQHDEVKYRTNRGPFGVVEQSSRFWTSKYNSLCLLCQEIEGSTAHISNLPGRVISLSAFLRLFTCNKFTFICKSIHLSLNGAERLRFGPFLNITSLRASLFFS